VTCIRRFDWHPALVTLALVATFALVAAGASAVVLAADRAGGVPAGFDPLVVSAVESGEVWVLGSAPCGSGQCAVVVRSDDGGSTFVRVGAPAVGVGNGREMSIRFADRENGFVYGALDGPLFATHDGGATWYPTGIKDVQDLAIGGVTVYAITGACGATGCARLQLREAGVRDDDWRTLPIPGRLVRPVSIAARASELWILGTRTRSPWSAVAKSVDGGRSFALRPGPCADLGGGLMPVDGGVVWAVCTTGLLAGWGRSTDGGSTFSRSQASLRLSNMAFLAPVSGSTAIASPVSGEPRLFRTRDGGRTWRRLVTAPRAIRIEQITFWRRVGIALVQPGHGGLGPNQIWRTSDSGTHWTRLTLR
jgi:hypothetical protein